MDKPDTRLVSESAVKTESNLAEHSTECLHLLNQNCSSTDVDRNAVRRKGSHSLFLVMHKGSQQREIGLHSSTLLESLFAGKHL